MHCLYHGKPVEVTTWILTPAELAKARRDAERVMGLRPAFEHVGQPYKERGQYLVPPAPGDPVRVAAERVLAIPEGATAAQLFFGGQCFIDQVEVLE